MPKEEKHFNPNTDWENEDLDIYEQETPKEKQTLLNAQLATLFEIRDKLSECNLHSEHAISNNLNPHDLIMWKYKIRSIYREVKSLVEEKDRKPVERALNKIKKLPKVVRTYQSPQGDQNYRIDRIAFFQHWEAINELDEEVRKLLNQKGMLVTFKDVDDDIADF